MIAQPEQRSVPVVAGSGRADVVAEAYAEYHAELVRFVASRTRDSELAADIAHEAFFRLVREHAAGRFPDLPLAWLRQVAMNLIVSRARRTSVADRWEPWLRPVAESDESPEASLLTGERDGIVRQAVAALPATARMALLLAAEGYGGREIAEHIGRSEGATRTLMCRARSRLRAELTEAVSA